MRTMARWLVLAAAALVSAASIGTQGKVGGEPYTAHTVKAPAGVTDEDLYAATVRIFNDAGWDIRDKDKDAGIVSTVFMHAGHADLTNESWHSWRARISEGALRLEIDCKVVTKDMSNITGQVRCDSNRREWTDAEPELRNKILADAEMRARKRAARAAGGQP